MNIFTPQEYCVNQIHNHNELEFELELIACNPIACSEMTPCIPKCCEVHQVWDFTKYPNGSIRCQPSESKYYWDPILNNDKPREEQENAPRMIVNHPRNWCTQDPNIYALKASQKIPRKDV